MRVGKREIDGKKMRVAVGRRAQAIKEKTGDESILVIPNPQVPKRVRLVGDRDTEAGEVTRESFVPNLKVSPVPEDCHI